MQGVRKIRRLILTKSTLLKSKQDPFFSVFIDDMALKFKHKESDRYGIPQIPYARYRCSFYAEYFYRDGVLVMFEESDGSVNADWIILE